MKVRLLSVLVNAPFFFANGVFDAIELLRQRGRDGRLAR